MKTKTILSLLLIGILGIQTFNAQSLNSKIKTSVVAIGETLTKIPTERLSILDQIAVKIYKQHNESGKLDVIMVDVNNSDTSQLAMIWLNTGLLYYGFSQMATIQSAGTNESSSNSIDLNRLKQWGFKIKDDTSKALAVTYGSGSWNISTKSLQSLNPDADTIEIVVKEGAITNKNTIALPFTDTETIAREMLYLATRINNLIELKK